MNTNTNKSKALRLSALLLLSGAAVATIGCNSNEKLFFTVNGKDLEVTFCDRGASIYSIKYKGEYMTYHPKNKNTFLRNDYYYGKALGRVAGRIKDGKINVDGTEYQLDINEKDNYYKNNNIHGGKDSITTKNFKRVVKETDEEVTVTFTYLSPALESKFPEDLYCVYKYTIDKTASMIDLYISGTPTGLTPVNLSNHPYFRLGNEGNILEHTLEMPGVESLAKFTMHEDNRTDQTVEGTIPIGNADITEWNFSAPKTIGKDITSAKAKDETSGGYDHIWKYSNRCQVKLKNPANGISLQVDSDADAVIMYANCYPHENDEMNPSGKDSLYAGITIEPIQFFTRDNLESIYRSPTDPFTRTIHYQFFKD